MSGLVSGCTASSSHMSQSDVLWKGLGRRDIRSSVVYVPVQNKACLYHVDPLNRICILKI